MKIVVKHFHELTTQELYNILQLRSEVFVVEQECIYQDIDGKDKNRTADSIPSILTDALAVSLDNAVGHDYLLDSDSRFEFYHKHRAVCR